MNKYKFDKEGNMVPIDVIIVWGSPASGKTTYVKDNMEDGDLVIDLDYIKQSISLSAKTECNDNLLDIAIGIRELLYDRVADREVDADNVWIVAGLPTAEERELLSVRVKATKLIHIDTDEKECIRRAMADKDRMDKDMQARIIEKWFRQFNYEG